MAAIRHRHLGFVVRVFGPPKKSIWCLYYCAKFSCNQCSNFDNMRVIYLTSLAWKCLFTPSLNGEPYQRNPKRHIFVRVCFVWVIMRENLSTGLTCGWVPEKREDFTHSPRSSPCTDAHQIWHSCRGRRRTYIWQMFWWSVEGVDSIGGRKLQFPIVKASRAAHDLKGVTLIGL